MSGGRIHWSFWGHCLPENRENGAESEGLDARLASALYAPLGCVMQGLKNKTLSSKISSHDWLRGEVRFICRLQRLPAWRMFCFPPSAHPRHLIPSAHPANSFAEVSFRIKQLFGAGFRSTTRIFCVPCFPGNADVAARCCHSRDQHTQACKQESPSQAPRRLLLPEEKTLWRLLARCQAVDNECA